MQKRKFQGVQALLIAIVFILQCLCGSSFVFADTAPTGTEYLVNKTQSEFTIDGILDEREWNTDIKISMVHSGTPNNVAVAGAVYSDKYLYVGVRVEDDMLINSGAPYAWNDDSVEIYIDGDLARGAYNAHTAQLVFRLNDPVVHIPANTFISGEGIVHKFFQTEKGYNLEVAIPWTTLGITPDRPGIGFTMHVNDKDNNDKMANAESILKLTGGGPDWQTSENWMMLVLGGSGGSTGPTGSTSLRVNSFDSVTGFAIKNLKTPLQLKDYYVSYDYFYPAPPGGSSNDGYVLWASYDGKEYNGMRLIQNKGSTLTAEVLKEDGTKGNINIENITINPGKWHNMLLHFKEDKTFEFYVNGVKATSGGVSKFGQYGKQVLAAIGYFGDLSSSSKNGCGYFDNIRVYTDSEVILEDYFDEGLSDGWTFFKDAAIADPEVNCPRNDLKTFSLESEKRGILLGKESRLELKGTMADGTVPNWKLAQVNVASSNPEVVQVEKAGDAYILHALSEGTSEIQATITYFGVQKMASISIKAVETAELDHIVIVSDPGQDKVQEGQTLALSVQGIMNDGSTINIDGQQVQWRCEPEERAQVVNEEGEILLKALSYGGVTVSAEVQVEGKSFTSQRLFTIEEKPGTITDLGIQVGTIRSNMNDIGKDKFGRDVTYTVLAGLPPKFYVCDVETGDVLEKYDLPGSEGAWEIKKMSDGTVYIGAYNAGVLFRYFPETQEIKAIGVPLEGYNPILLQIVEVENGRIFGGSTGTGCLYEYDPVQNKFTNHGRLVEGANIVRGLEYDPETGILYAGVTGANMKAYLIAYNTVTRTKEDILPGKYDNIGNVSDMTLIGRKLFCRKEIGNGMFVMDVDTKQLIEAKNAETGELSTDIVMGGRNISEPSPYDPDRIFFISQGTLYYYDLSKDEYGSMNTDKVAGAMRWAYVEMDGDGFTGYNLVAQIDSHGTFLVYNLQTGNIRQFSLKLTAEPVKINSTTKGPDGKVYSGGYVGGGVGSYDPLTGEQEKFYRISQIEGLTNYGDDKLYLGAYSQALVFEYDLNKPWQRIDTSAPSTNPLFLFNLYDNDEIPDYALQDRPYTLLGIPEEKKVAIGTAPAVNYYGGVLAFFNVETREREVFWNIVPDQTVVSLLYDGGLLYGGTSVRPGYNTPARATEAKFFIWDMKENKIIYETTPVNGKMDITALIKGPDGNIWGIANDALFIFDIETRQVIYQKATGLKSRFVDWRDNNLVLGIDGNIYGTNVAKQLYRINTQTKEITVLDQDAGRYLSQDDFGNLYFANEERLYRYSNEKLVVEPQSLEISVEKNTLNSGQSLPVKASAILDKGRRITNMNISGIKPVYTSGNPAVAEILDGILVARGSGETTVQAEVHMFGKNLTSNKIQIKVRSGENEVEEPVEEPMKEPDTAPVTPPAVNNRIETDTDGSVKIKADIKIDQKNSTVYNEITEEDMKQAIEKAKKDVYGNRKIIIHLPKVDGIEHYVQKLPKSAVTSGGAENRIEIRTPLATAIIPGNMLDRVGALDKETVEIVIKPVGRNLIAQDLKEKIGERPLIELAVRNEDKIVEWNNSRTPVAVSIDYKPTAEETAAHEHIVVWYIDEKGNAVPIPNGKFDITEGKVNFEVTHFGKFAVAFVDRNFQDIMGYDWAEKEIRVLASKGIINGTGDESFSPGENITRADFITLLVRALELRADYTERFDDIQEGSYYSDSINIARKLGIVKGTGDNKFNPDETISRQDMITMIANALKASGRNLENATIADIAGYKDTASISDYAMDSVALLVKNKLVIGDDRLINPNGKTIRAEAAVILYRIMNK